jgi:hypothetical protein
MNACCQREPSTGGITGGAAICTSPVGMSGAGRRVDRLITMLLTGRLPTRAISEPDGLAEQAGQFVTIVEAGSDICVPVESPTSIG